MNLTGWSWEDYMSWDLALQQDKQSYALWSRNLSNHGSYSSAIWFCLICHLVLPFHVGLNLQRNPYPLSLEMAAPLWKQACLLSSLTVSEVTQSCPTRCEPVDRSLPGSSVHGIVQARILEWVTISFSRGSSRPWDRTPVSRIRGRHFNLWATRGSTFLCQCFFFLLISLWHNLKLLCGPH